MIRRHKWKFFFLSLLIILALLGFVSRSVNVPLGNNDYARITPMPLWRALFPEANCKISYKSKDGQTGNIVLWQSLFDGPVSLFSTSDTNVLLCLYDFDVDYRLFRIDTSKLFKPLPRDSYLNRIIFKCSWEIQDGRNADWQEVLNYLHKVSPNAFARQSVSVGMRFYETPKSILMRLEYQGIKSVGNQ